MSLFERAASRNDGYRDIDVKSVADARPNVRIVDVREAHELTSELGHIPGAEHVPMGQFPAAAEDWEKDDEVVLVCRSGNRSGRVAAMLAAQGFTRLMNMVGGMIAYGAAGLPVAR